MKPSEVLQRHVELAEALKEPGLRSLVRSTLEEWLEFLNKAKSHKVNERFLSAIALHVASAHTYLVTAGMNEAVFATASTYLTGVETSHDDPPPQGCGVAFFERPLHLPELRGRDQLVHAVSWGPAQMVASDADVSRSLIIVMLWSDVRRDVDEVLIESPESVDKILRAAAGFSPILVATLSDGQRVGPARVGSRPEDIEDAVADGADPVKIIHESPNVLRWTMALWRLLKDTVATRREVVPPSDRAVRRRAQRAKLAPCVAVVTLRREARQVFAPGTGTPLQWRSPVGGHWHTYWTGPGRTVKEQRWVSLYERGPEGAPYKPKKGTVHRLAR